MREQDNLLVIQSKAFAKRIIFICRDIKLKYKENILTSQLVRSGTSIGANIHEANYAHSKPDFVAKLEIALKECYETEYWLELLFETDYLSNESFQSLKNDCGTIRRILIASCKTAKENRRKSETGVE